MKIGFGLRMWCPQQVMHSGFQHTEKQWARERRGRQLSKETRNNARKNTKNKWQQESVMGVFSQLQLVIGNNNYLLSL